jgi:hypothetical protein
MDSHRKEISGKVASVMMPNIVHGAGRLTYGRYFISAQSAAGAGTFHV